MKGRREGGKRKTEQQDGGGGAKDSGFKPMTLSKPCTDVRDTKG